MNASDIRLARVGAICGGVGTLIYVGLGIAGAMSSQPKTAADVLREMGTTPHAMWEHFAVVGAAVLWAVGFIGMGTLLGESRYRNAARVGTIFGVVACGVVTVMLIVQGAVMVKMGQAFVAAADADRQAVLTLYRGLRVIDQGMDLAFDTFFFTGWICLCVAMMAHPRFSKVLVSLVLAIFIIDTPIQLWYAPTPPPFDVGPFGSILLLGVYAQAWYAARKLVSTSEARAAVAGG